MRPRPSEQSSFFTRCALFAEISEYSVVCNTIQASPCSTQHITRSRGAEWCGGGGGRTWRSSSSSPPGDDEAARPPLVHEDELDEMSTFEAVLLLYETFNHAKSILHKKLGLEESTHEHYIQFVMLKCVGIGKRTLFFRHEKVTNFKPPYLGPCVFPTEGYLLGIPIGIP